MSYGNAEIGVSALLTGQIPPPFAFEVVSTTIAPRALRALAGTNMLPDLERSSGMHAHAQMVYMPSHTQAQRSM